MNTPRILDCTIRDGSYVVDFQFTAEDTAVIAAGLESAGIEWIEIGHGLGLNASNAGKGAAAATDERFVTVIVHEIRPPTATTVGSADLVTARSSSGPGRGG